MRILPNVYRIFFMGMLCLTVLSGRTLMGQTPETTPAAAPAAPAAPAAAVEETLPGEEFTLLVTETTQVISRVDLNKFDLTKLTGEVTKLASSFIDSMPGKPEEKEQMKKAAPLMITMMLGQYAVPIEELKSAGVTQFYIISTPEEAPLSTAYFAFPSKGKTPEQIQKIREVCSSLRDMNVNLRFPFNRHGFIISPIAGIDASDEQLKSYIKRRFTRLTPVSKPEFAQEFARRAETNDTVTVVAISKTKALLGDGASSETEENGAATAPAAPATPPAIPEANKDKKLEPIELPPMVMGLGIDTAVLQKFAEHAQSIVDDVVSMSYGFNANTLELDMDLCLQSEDKAHKLMDVFGKIYEELVKTCKDQASVDKMKELKHLATPHMEGTYAKWKFDQKFVNSYRELIAKGMVEAKERAAGAKETPAVPAKEPKK